LDELNRALEPCPIDRSRSIIAELASMPSRGEDDPAKRRMLFEQYLAICSDVPEWALRSAVMAFLRNEAGAKFRPTAGELRSFAMRKVEGVAAERARLRAVLAAEVAPRSKPIDAGRRKQLADMLRGVLVDQRQRIEEPTP
jgi:hypothetical protein